VLHGDEVAVTEVAGRAVAARAAVVVRVELDEALTAVANHVDGQQAHLALQLTFDVFDDGRAGFDRSGIDRAGNGGRAGRAGRSCRLRPAKLINLSPQCCDLACVGTGSSPEEAAETEEKNGERRGDDRGNRYTTVGHHELQVRQPERRLRAFKSARK
jgi:hypothetical protein